MKARLEREWISQRVNIWIYEDGPSGIRVLSPDGTLVPQPADVALPAPTLHLHESALAALVAAASNVLPASDATQAHLADTITIRDRLLAIVEQRLTADLGSSVPTDRLERVERPGADAA